MLNVTTCLLMVLHTAQYQAHCGFKKIRRQNAITHLAHAPHPPLLALDAIGIGKERNQSCSEAPALAGASSSPQLNAAVAIPRCLSVFAVHTGEQSLLPGSPGFGQPGMPRGCVLLPRGHICRHNARVSLPSIHLLFGLHRLSTLSSNRQRHCVPSWKHYGVL